MSAVFAFEDQVGLAEAFLDVAEFFEDVAGDIARGVVDPGGIRLVVDDGRAGFNGIFDLQDGRKHFVLDLDEAASLFRDGARFGRDGGDAIADEADLVVEEVGVVR